MHSAVFTCYLDIVRLSYYITFGVVNMSILSPWLRSYTM